MDPVRAGMSGRGLRGAGRPANGGTAEYHQRSVRRGKAHATLVRIGSNCLVDDLEELATTYPGIKAFRKGVDEFRTYVRRNADTIPNYAERYRYGERVSTAFAESTVNAVVGKRFSKRQQMRWSRRGAHLMLRTRTRVLDDTLRAKFQSWYPGLFDVQNAAPLFGTYAYLAVSA